MRIFIIKNLTFDHLITYKTNILYITEKAVWKGFLWIFKRTHKKYNWFWKEQKCYRQQKKNLEEVCYFCGKRILKKLSKSINFWKVRDNCHYAGKYRIAAHNICNLKFNMPNEIPVVFITVQTMIIILL